MYLRAPLDPPVGEGARAKVSPHRNVKTGPKIGE